MAENITLKIEGMGCAKCTEKVEKALAALDGVSDIKVSLEENAAHFTLSAPASRDQAVEAVEDSGYDVIS
ncbi:heavy-metal-associated domain-containing protein [Martelella mediterranea]|uniref:Copper chaperone n=1 Tax=Martelella mediterranea TaxID=293089 RepID=A0A4R3NRY9_9HYPH|nr:heavy metal-associated domain-containing protein [Martelella mediterranea]TCT39556.1 copper chaperone [Martelella mediterranea]